jgi:hypothetical protein
MTRRVDGTPRVSAAGLTLGFVLSALSSPACRADESVLDEIYPCDLETGDAQCGTDEDGKPMTCYAGSAQLGGKAFCTKTCDPTVPAEEGFLCTSSGALLERCDPGGGSCPSPLECYRTDVVLEDGLCMLVPVCPYKPDTTELDDAQCTISHPVCAGSLLRNLSTLPISIDNLHCVARPCREELGCPSVPLPEVCPTQFYDPLASLPVTCAVQCDRFTCPPNFTCIGSSDGSPPVCLPGVLGMRCTSNEDCITGDCIDTGAGFSVCTFSAGCATDEDCRDFGSNPGFTCVEGVPGAGSHCISTIPFQGANCELSSECSADLRCGSAPCPPRFCSHYSPFQVDPPHGECRFRCERGEGCPAFGGLPHTCLEDGSCYPAAFSIPCDDSSDCYANLTCAAVPTDERSRSTAPKICTRPCSDDEDCSPSVNPWLGLGYCVDAPEAAPGTTGFCRPVTQMDGPCERNAHCASGCCAPAGLCAPAENCEAG